jgi:hypothetical protein
LRGGLRRGLLHTYERTARQTTTECRQLSAERGLLFSSEVCRITGADSESLPSWAFFPKTFSKAIKALTLFREEFAKALNTINP